MKQPDQHSKGGTLAFPMGSFWLCFRLPFSRITVPPDRIVVSWLFIPVISLKSANMKEIRHWDGFMPVNFEFIDTSLRQTPFYFNAIPGKRLVDAIKRCGYRTREMDINYSGFKAQASD